MQEESSNILKAKEFSTQQHKTHNVWHLIKKKIKHTRKKDNAIQNKGKKPSDRSINYSDDRISRKGH